MKVFKQEDSRIYVFERGEVVLKKLTEVLAEEKIQAGVLSALGALTDVELGFYHLDRKDYDRKVFEDEYELVSMVGNIALKDGAVYVHAHAALGREDFSLFGGHLFEARSAVTVEVTVFPFKHTMVREFNADVGLATLSSCRA